MQVYREHPNVAVLRTFSKAYGLAGLRVGFLVAQPPVAEAVRKTMLPFTVNALAQAAAIASLAAEAELLDRVDLVVKERSRVRDELLAQGWTVPPTEANFVWLRLGGGHPGLRRPPARRPGWRSGRSARRAPGSRSATTTPTTRSWPWPGAYPRRRATTGPRRGAPTPGPRSARGSRRRRRSSFSVTRR